MNFVEELEWRGMIHDIMPGLKDHLEKEITTAYLGIDPTADSLHIGHLVGVMLLKHFQVSGHKPIALVGGATGMIGDPSGKSQERNLLNELTLRHNQECIKNQLRKFLTFSNYEIIAKKISSLKVLSESAKEEITKARKDLGLLYRNRNTQVRETKQNNNERFEYLTNKRFDIPIDELNILMNEPENVAVLVNNYDWMKKFKFLEFIRDIGKHITVNYMMSKDSVKKRLGAESKEGMSFTEFTYQLVQGYDFLFLNENYSCKLQMGGSDQWGNITTGTELIRRKGRGEAFALTCPLITKADGSKFGKTESGNIWLDPARTTPYNFYQFWLNTSDEDAERYIRIFTLLSQGIIITLINQHKEAPHLRILQKKLAEEITVMVHSKDDYEMAVEASQILFGNGTAEQLRKLNESTFLSVFEGVPQFTISKAEIESGINVVELLAGKTGVFDSKGELRRTIQGNGLSINKEKVSNADLVIDNSFLISNKYILAQKGKKNYSLIIIG